MKEEETFRVLFPIHKGFKQTLPLPLALLRYYRDVGLNESQFLYLLHILDTYITDQAAASVKQIARLMGVNVRTLQRHNAYFRQHGLVAIRGQFQNGSQVENAYDFTPLLDKVMELWALDNPLLVRIDNIAPFLDQMVAVIGGRVEELKGKGEIGSLLGQMVEAWQHGSTPPDTNVTGGGDTTITPPGDTNVRGNDDDDDLHTTDISDDHHHQQPLPNGKAGTLVDNLIAIGFDRRDANFLVNKAGRVYGSPETARVAIRGWLAEIERKGKQIVTPAGFLRAKVERGSLPPVPAEQRKQHIPDELKHIVKR